MQWGGLSRCLESFSYSNDHKGIAEFIYLFIYLFILLICKVEDEVNRFKLSELKVMNK